MTGLAPTSRASEADFAVIPCAGADFLINREEILHSRYEGEHQRAAGRAAPVRVMEFEGRAIPVINLDGHIEEHFGMVPHRGPGILLFIRGSGDHPPFPLMRRKSDGTDVDTSRVALRTSAMVSMLSVGIDELKPFPPRLRESLAAGGLLAVRFPRDGGRAQYLLDMRTTAILCIAAYHNRQVADGHPDS